MCVHLDEGLAGEILVRLPARSVLRFRAVCKEWRRITACPGFQDEHARRRPLEVLLYTRTRVGPDDVAYLELGSLPVAADRQMSRRPLARFPEHEERPSEERRQYCCLLGSCDGLLLLRTVARPAFERYTNFLLKIMGAELYTHVLDWLRPWLGIRTRRQADYDAQQYLICNPVTGQWSDLPRPTGDTEHGEIGFYFHSPTGEYRLLSHVRGEGEGSYYCVFSTGAKEPRRLSVQAIDFSTGGFGFQMARGILHGHLHWLNPMNKLTSQMLAFDTVAETFRWMPHPPVTCKDAANLFVADGSLVASKLLLGQPLVDLWVLEGYGGTAERWERRHRVRHDLLCPTDKLQLAMGGDGGDVILGTRYGVVAYNMRSGTVRKVAGIDASRGHESVLSSQSVFRESLVRHSFFDARPHPGLPFFKFCA